MKLIILIDDLLCGGTEFTLRARLQHFPKGWKLKILVLYAKGTVGELIANMGFEIEFIDFKKLGYYKGIKKIRRITEDFKPDKLIFFRDVTRGLLPYFITFSNAEKFLFWDSTVIYRSMKQFLAEFFQVMFVNHKKICSSSAIARKLKKMYLCNQAYICYNCYDEKRFFFKDGKDFSFKENRKIRILSVGNMRFEKNHIDKLKTALNLKESGVLFKMDIVGMGDFSSLKNLRDRYNLEEEVSFLGEIKCLENIIHEYDFFFMTSFAEGCPVSLLESMASGLLCISYMYDGLENIDPENKYIIKVDPATPENASTQFQAAIKGEINISQRSLETASYTKQNFSSKNSALLWWKIFENEIN